MTGNGESLQPKQLPRPNPFGPGAGLHLPPAFPRYAGAIGLVALATWLTAGLEPVSHRLPFALFFAAVALSAWYGGLGPGLLATALSAATSIYLFLPPFYAFQFGLDELVQAGVFVLVALLIAGLNEARRQAQLSLYRQREQGRVALANIGDGVIVTDAHGRVTFLNGLAEILTGWPLAEAAGRPLGDVFAIIDEQSRQPVADPAAQVIRSGRPINLSNSTLLARDGRELAVEPGGAPFRNETGALGGVVLVFRDASERSERQERAGAEARFLEASRWQQDLLERLIQNAPVGIAILRGPQYHYVLANSEYAKLARGKEPLLGRTVAEVWPELAGGIVPLLDTVYTTGEPYTNPEQSWRVNRDGVVEEIVVASNYLCLAGEAGRPDSILVLSEDITEQVKARRQIEEAYALLDTVFASAPVGLAFWDRELRFVRINEALAEMNGLPVEAHLGRTPQELFPGVTDIDQLMETLRQILTTGQPVLNVEVSGETPAAPGQTRYWLESWYPIRRGEEIIGIGNIVQEITGRRLVEERLKASLREKEVLLREIHHRVRNNLQAISNLLYWQAAGTHNRETLDILQETQNRIHSIALIHAKLYQTTDLAHVDFAGYVRQLVAQLVRSYRINSESVRLTMELDDVPVDVDLAVPLGIIINELVTNALKHAFPPEGQPGGVPAEISISLQTAPYGQPWLLVVRDNGAGLPESVDVAKPVSTGLQLVTALGQHMRGAVTFERDGGTTVKVSFVPLEWS